MSLYVCAYRSNVFTWLSSYVYLYALLWHILYVFISLHACILVNIFVSWVWVYPCVSLCDLLPCIWTIAIFFFFWLHHTTCRILVSQPGIKPCPTPTGEAQSPNHQRNPYTVCTDSLCMWGPVCDCTRVLVCALYVSICALLVCIRCFLCVSHSEFVPNS